MLAAVAVRLRLSHYRGRRKDSASRNAQANSERKSKNSDFQPHKISPAQFVRYPQGSQLRHITRPTVGKGPAARTIPPAILPVANKTTEKAQLFCAVGMSLVGPPGHE